MAGRASSRQSGTTRGKERAKKSLIEDRRRHARFSSMCRVDYDVDERGTFAFTASISSGGMRLKNTRVSLREGEQYTFALHLPGAAAPVQIAGTVVNSDRNGAGIQFCEGQDQAVKAIRDFIEAKHVSALEKMPRVLRKPEKMAALVQYYLEVGRTAAAADILRTFVENGTDDIGIYETLTTLLIQQVEEGSPDSAEVIDDLAETVRAGLSLGRSDILTKADKRIDGLRVEQERLAEEARKEEEARAHEALVNEVRVEVERQVAQERKDADRAHAAEVAALEQERRRLDNALTEMEKRCESLQGRMQQEQAKLAEEKQSVKELAASLKKRQAELKQEADALAAERKELAKQTKQEQKQLASQAAEIETERKQLAGQQTAVEKATAELLARQNQLEQATDRIEQKRKQEESSITELLSSVSKLDKARDKVMEQLRLLAESHRDVTGTLNRQISALQKRETRRREVVTRARTDDPKSR